MITKKDTGYEFNAYGIEGELLSGDGYILKIQNQEVVFSNLKMLHLFVNTLTDIVENIDSIENPKF